MYLTIIILNKSLNNIQSNPHINVLEKVVIKPMIIHNTHLEMIQIPQENLEDLK